MGLITNMFPQIAQNVKPACKRMVQNTAKAVRDEAQAGAPVDTGTLQRSIYATGAGLTSGYGGINPEAKLTSDSKGFSSRRRIKNFIKRRERQREVQQLLFDEVAPPPDETTAYVVVGATYGIYVEMGTWKMAAQPYFYPAIDAGNEAFAIAAASFEGDLAAGVSTI